MSIEDESRVETESITLDQSKAQPELNFILEYIKRFGDCIFEVCMDCFEDGEIVSISSRDSALEMNESDAALQTTASHRGQSL
ncbi:MAG: hypothetical protein RTU92_14225 [Candidatus Thorarchaeota archaeon]